MKKGFKESNLNTSHSDHVYDQWLNNSCQPNYFINVYNQSTSCPPYQPEPIPVPVPVPVSEMEAMARKTDGHRVIKAHLKVKKHRKSQSSYDNHDTIGMITIDGKYEYISCGTSTNGANHKIAGRVVEFIFFLWHCLCVCILCIN